MAIQLLEKALNFAYPLRKLERSEFLRDRRNKNLPSYNNLAYLANIPQSLHGIRGDTCANLRGRTSNYEFLEFHVENLGQEFYDSISKTEQPLMLDNIALYNTASRPFKATAKRGGSKVEFYIKEFDRKRLVGLVLSEILNGSEYTFQYSPGKVIVEDVQDGEHLERKTLFENVEILKERIEAGEKGLYLGPQDVGLQFHAPEEAKENYQREVFRFAHMVEFMRMNDMLHHFENWVLQKIKNEGVVVDYHITPIDFNEIFGIDQLANETIRRNLSILSGVADLPKKDQPKKFSELYNQGLADFQEHLKVQKEAILSFAEAAKGLQVSGPSGAVDVGEYVENRFHEYLTKGPEKAVA